MAGTSMAEMVGSGVIEGLQPDTRHGVEAQLALENNASIPDNASIPNIVSHRLDLTQQQPHTNADAQHAVNGAADPLVNSSVHKGRQAHTGQPGQAANHLGHEGHQAHTGHSEQALDALVHGGHQAQTGQSGHVANPLVHEGHHTHTGQAGQVIHENLAGSADPAVQFQLGADTGIVGHTLHDSGDTPSGLNAERHGIHDDVHSKHRQDLGAAHDGVFGSRSDVLPQAAGYGGVLSQLLSFGVPVACVFVAVAFVLWKRLGASRPLTSSTW